MILDIMLASLFHSFEFPFNEADRTLCPITPLTINQTTPVYIDLFTNSPSPVNYNISVEPVPNYELRQAILYPWMCLLDSIPHVLFVTDHRETGLI